VVLIPEGRLIVVERERDEEEEEEVVPNVYIYGKLVNGNTG